MTKTTSFAVLDYQTVKPYLGAKNLGLFAIWIAFLSAMTGDVMMSAGIGFMLAVMLAGYPFTIGEKTNMDALYTTISVNKQTVVRGRYLFTLAFDVFSVGFSLLCGTLGGVIAAQLGRDFSFGDPWSAFPLALVMVVVQTVQLPLYFKFGYTKTRLMSVIPFILLGALYAGIAALGNGGDFETRMLDFFTRLAESEIALFTAAAAVLVLLVFISYRLSVAFYKKREF